MTVEDFHKAFNKEIKEVAARIRQPYSVGEAELTTALHASAKKYLATVIELATQRSKQSSRISVVRD